MWYNRSVSMESEGITMYNKINEILDNYARQLVGVLCKRVEVLSQENALTPNLYKALAKEIVYENIRNLKAILEVYINVGTVVFEEPKNDSKKE